jgi:hypothetical protein
MVESGGLVGAGAQVWDGAPAERRRGILRVLVDEIKITPSADRGGRFDPSRISVAWRA